MIKLLDIFVSENNKYFKKYKLVNHIPQNQIKYKPCHIFKDMHCFLDNCCYFSKYEGKYMKGTYLNKIHHFLIDYSFYDILYGKLLDIYFNLTNYESLNELSGDSFFIRNINGCKLNSRNPKYYNKPGFKVNIIIDKLRTPITPFH